MGASKVIEQIARAKINLTLHVGRVANSALHPLESLVVFADIGDELLASPAQGFSLSIDGPFGEGLSAGEDNLILKAAHLANESLGLSGASFHLTKCLPVASGIGGGSADAAAAIRALEAMAGRSAGLTAADLMTIGADVPVCYLSQTCLMAGAGETLTPQPASPQMPALLVNPGAAVSTGEIFKRFDAANPLKDAMTHLPFKHPPLKHSHHDNLLERALAGTNDLQSAAAALAPEILTVLDALGQQAGARLVRMSGSGATCFAIFESTDQAEAAKSALLKARPNWWAQTALLGDPK